MVVACEGLRFQSHLLIFLPMFLAPGSSSESESSLSRKWRALRRIERSESFRVLELENRFSMLKEWDKPDLLFAYFRSFQVQILQKN